tara:strand:+ start:692 stop:829 length:138 start_codon:yes stop_codon:yes gene_type:complete
MRAAQSGAVSAHVEDTKYLLQRWPHLSVDILRDILSLVGEPRFSE